MMRRTWMTAGAVVVSMVLVGACSSDGGDATTTTEKVTTTSTAPKDLSVSTPEGDVSLSLDGKLPSDWPKDFPTPDRTEVAGSGSLAGNDSGVMVGVYTTKESGQDAFDFYAKDDSLQPTNSKSAGPRQRVPGLGRHRWRLRRFGHRRRRQRHDLHRGRAQHRRHRIHLVDHDDRCVRRIDLVDRQHHHDDRRVTTAE